MINPGYTLKPEDIATMRSMKGTAAYSNYLRAIAQSPAFTAIMDEHINDINIAPDIKRLQDEKLLPTGIKVEALNSLFKQSLARMAMGITADSVILKELENVRMQDVLNDINDDFDMNYLLGKAPKDLYDKVAVMIENGEVKEDSLLYKGLMTYMKKSSASTTNTQNECLNTGLSKKPETKKTTTRKEEPTIDLDSDDIKL